jgi:hypothetical protein
MARVIIFGLLGALWTFLCLVLLFFVIAGSGLAGVAALLLTTFDAQRVTDLLAEYGALGVFVIWLTGAIVLALIAWAMRATRARIVIVAGDHPGERPMKDVTPPKDAPRDEPRRELPPR